MLIAVPVAAYVASEAYDRASDGVLVAMESVQNAQASVSDALCVVQNEVEERKQRKYHELAQAVRLKYKKRTGASASQASTPPEKRKTSKTARERMVGAGDAIVDFITSL